MAALRLVVLLLVPLALAWAYLSGALAAIDQEAIQTFLSRSGAWGPLAYVAAFALLEPFGVPGIAFVVPATFAWPLWQAYLLSWAGSIGAGIVGFSFARWIGRDWVKQRLPERLTRYDERLAERGLLTVIIVRLVFFLFQYSL